MLNCLKLNFNLFGSIIPCYTRMYGIGYEENSDEGLFVELLIANAVINILNQPLF